MAVKRICARHEIVYVGRGGCPACRDEDAASRAPTEADRIRSSAAWKRAQKLCIADAEGRCTYGLEATDRGATHYEDGRCPVEVELQAHHRIPIEDGGAPFDQENLRCVCATHHARLEAAYRATRRRSA